VGKCPTMQSVVLRNAYMSKHNSRFQLGLHNDVVCQYRSQTAEFNLKIESAVGQLVNAV
jgi:hypothetical protein